MVAMAMFEGGEASTGELAGTSLRERMSFSAASLGSGLGPDPDSSFDTALHMSNHSVQQ